MEFMKKVGEICEKVGDTATDAYNTVADKSGKLIEETKLKISISEKQTEIDEVYEEIGKAVYNAYKSGEDVGKEFTKQAKKIEYIKNDMDIVPYLTGIVDKFFDTTKVEIYLECASYVKLKCGVVTMKVCEGRNDQESCESNQCNWCSDGCRSTCNN